MHPLSFSQDSVSKLGTIDLHLQASLNHCHLSADVAQTEECAGQKLLDMEEQKKQRESELERLEEQLKQYTAKSQLTDSELQYPRLCLL